MKSRSEDSTNDKRKYFRVDDLAFLSYKIVSWADVRLSKKNNDRLPVDKLTFKANLDRISRELKPLYNVIKSSNSNVARYLSALDEKITLLSDYVLEDDDETHNVEPQQVNIGGGGLLFVSDKPILMGAILELKMKLLPEDLSICSYAKVISCVQNEGEDKSSGYRIAVEFEFMDDDVRDLITRHVLTKEQALINRM